MDHAGSSPPRRTPAWVAPAPAVEATTEPVPLHWRVVLGGLARLPQGALSRLFGRIADIGLPRLLRRPLLGTFVRGVGIDMSEAAQPLETYSTLNSLFVRELRAGARSWPADARVAGCPVDGIAGQLGAVEDGMLVQAKGRSYSIARLLDDAGEAERFVRGSFVTLYLTPRHYHRIHSPCDGAVVAAKHVPGGLLPVNPPAVASVDDLFVRNERLVCWIEGTLGRVAVVAIGAYNVGRISTAFDDAWAVELGSPAVTNRRRAAVTSRFYQPPRAVRRGEEIMAFHMGSSVVVVVEEGVELDPALAPGREVRLGQALAKAG